MSTRESVNGNVATLASQIADGSLAAKPGCYLEVSSFVWNNASELERAHFELACARRGVPYEVVQQIGRVAWVCAGGE